ncbi:hypothetical protein [Bulleidia sp. zg-1006]|uniref:hypothetical protein n=1 Tax=Bulleidia sp. zg-1006 TaxID=2806552 RepID=UPI00193AB318|nr:hypothetical protein [Bulleidia sp. zg-1006]QRG87193.1 hypothetical protein JOS54_02475 [Bulleidia sp. zg-1006]
MYYICHNVLHNINTTRVAIYKDIYDMCKNNNNNINAETIKSISERNKTSLNYVKDEVEGMLYSAYSVISGGDCKLSDKGFTDINILLNENEEQFFEIPITINLLNEYVEFIINDVDIMSDYIRLSLINNSWSRNKTKQRYRKKVNSEFQTIELINRLIAIIENININDYDFNPDSLVDNIIKYGNYRKLYNDYKAWINFRGCYFSITLEKYLPVYQELFNECVKSVEWGGNTVHRNYIKKICMNFGYDFDKFLTDALSDGMIREIGDKNYSITGHANSIKESIANKYSNYRISLILRLFCGKPILLIGQNSFYDKLVSKEIVKDSKPLSNYWVEYIGNSLIEEKILSIIKSFGYRFKEV